MNNSGYKISEELVKRYLGIKADMRDIKPVYDSVCEEVLQTASPKRICRVFDAKMSDGFYSLDGIDITLKSHSVNRCFKSCKQIAVTAATLGSAIDKKIAAYQRTDVLRSAVFDACASVLAESVSQSLRDELCQSYPYAHLTVAYSPGYGDLPLELQSEIISKLSADKLLGITVNSAYLMTPMKSVTAFIGISETPQPFCDTCFDCALFATCDGKCNKVKI